MTSPWDVEVTSKPESVDAVIVFERADDVSPDLADYSTVEALGGRQAAWVAGGREWGPGRVHACGEAVRRWFGAEQRVGAVQRRQAEFVEDER